MTEPTPPSQNERASGEHIQFIDYLRGIAVLSIFLLHCVAPNLGTGVLELDWNGWLRDFRVPLSFLVTLPFTMGWIGVPIFFVVSGFCIHLSHKKSRAKGWDVYALRRFFRIYPPYLLALLVFALVFPGSRLDFSETMRHHHSQFFFSVLSLGSHLFMVHNFNGGVAWSINVPFWSIAVEVQLYALYPLLIFIANRLGWSGALWITGAIEVGLRTISSVTHLEAEWFTLDPLYFWFSWSVGAALAEAYVERRAVPFGGVSLLLFPLLTLNFYMIHPLSDFCFTLASLATARFIACWMQHPEKMPFVSRGKSVFLPHLRFAGTVSYSFYLIHAPILALLFNSISWYCPQIPVLALYILCVAAWFPILLLSHLMYRLVEQPSIAWGKWWIQWRDRRKSESEDAPLLGAES